jgi:hypothetical protein
VDLAHAGAGDPEAWRERSRPAETQAQRRFATGPHPWMALIGFGFSVRRRPEVVFDERMTGWGSEDRELALRLFLDGYAFRCPSELDDVLHFTTPERLTHERLAQAIRNKLYLSARYAPADVAPALEVMRRWHLDPATDRWFAGKPRDEPLEAIVAEARAWLAAH